MRHLVMLAVFSICVACASGVGAPAGGIEGRVTTGPTCPVQRADSPCPPGIWTGTVRATSSDGAAHESTTSSDGSYRLALEPGTYTVTAVVEGAGPPIAKPVTVTVGSTMQTLDLQVDSGIR
jgi:Carboxypeptidase regulatory-like domain